MKTLILEPKTDPNFANNPELVQACKEAMEKISEMGPSDNDVKLILDVKGNEFIATVKMASVGLAFTLQSIAQSPFMAVESATKAAISKVNKWSMTRRQA